MTGHDTRTNVRHVTLILVTGHAALALMSDTYTRVLDFEQFWFRDKIESYPEEIPGYTFVL